MVLKKCPECGGRVYRTSSPVEGGLAFLSCYRCVWAEVEKPPKPAWDWKGFLVGTMLFLLVVAVLSGLGWVILKMP